MKTIWKFQLTADTDMPVGAEILKVGFQGEAIMGWAMVESTDEREIRHFISLGTGWNLGDDGNGFVGAYIDTVMAPSGLVWHVFEVDE